ncbi:MAG: glucose 1-dehydrogenase [Acidobacteria bacterium]|jgi:NAD(P)-dependent dehydrogenase (short-subunit alcohol dehydrogenase family)|nr:glucose 1-dehydrogenase [Acidobacteriota bacterium]
MIRVAIVTGASSGIGRATILRLAKDGMAVFAVGRDDKALDQVCQEVVAAGGEAERLVADVTARDSPQRIVSGATARWGGVDALVNAAGIIASASVADTTDDAFDVMMDINVRASFRLIREAVPALSERQGAVVNLSSVAGTRSFPGLLAYCVSKAAVDQLTRCAALDLAPQRVRVNAVNPGVVITNLHKRGGMDDARYAAFLEHSKATHPLGRAGTPEEVADLIAFLVSPVAGWITGETISIDGGRHLTCLR